MKKILLAYLLIVITLIFGKYALAQQTIEVPTQDQVTFLNPAIVGGGVPAAGGGASLIFSETWNGTTEDNTWTWADPNTGSYDDDYTSGPMEGAQCVFMESDGGGDEVYNLSPNFTAQSEVWIFFQIKFFDFSSGDTSHFFRFGTGGQTPSARGMVRMKNTASTTDKYFEAQHQGEGYTASSGTIAVDTLYNVLVRYKVGSGANGELDVNMSTDTTWGNGDDVTIVITDGTGTESVDTIRFLTYSNHGHRLDYIEVDDVAIPDGDPAT